MPYGQSAGRRYVIVSAPGTGDVRDHIVVQQFGHVDRDCQDDRPHTRFLRPLFARPFTLPSHPRIASCPTVLTDLPRRWKRVHRGGPRVIDANASQGAPGGLHQEHKQPRPLLVLDEGRSDGQHISAIQSSQRVRDTDGRGAAHHASIESTRIYLHLADDWLASQYRAAAEVLDAQLYAAGGAR